MISFFSNYIKTKGNSYEEDNCYNSFENVSEIPDILQFSFVIYVKGGFRHAENCIAYGC